MYAVEGYEPHYASHEERGPRIKQYLSPIYKHYRALERSAHEARYQTTAFSEYDVRDLRQQHLQSLKNYILEGLKPPKRG